MPSPEERPMSFRPEEQPDEGEGYRRLLSHRSPSEPAQSADQSEGGLLGLNAEDDGYEPETRWPFTDEDTRLELVNGSSGPPRLYIGPNGRPLTPAEQLRWSNYLHAIERLREIDPTNPQLQSAYSPTWVPDNKDIADVVGATRAAPQQPTYLAPEFDLHLGPLWREVGKVRRDLELQSLEWHHPLVTQLRKYYNDNGISEPLREQLGYYMWMNEHRGVGGLHPYWNRDWKRFADQYGTVKPEQIQEHLLELLRRYDQLRTP
jgi:hypothetical protein